MHRTSSAQFSTWRFAIGNAVGSKKPNTKNVSNRSDVDFSMQNQHLDTNFQYRYFYPLHQYREIEF